MPLDPCETSLEMISHVCTEYDGGMSTAGQIYERSLIELKLVNWKVVRFADSAHMYNTEKLLKLSMIDIIVSRGLNRQNLTIFNKVLSRISNKPQYAATALFADFILRIENCNNFHSVRQHDMLQLNYLVQRIRCFHSVHEYSYSDRFKHSSAS